MRVEVTERMAQEGTRDDSGSCPIALALLAMYPGCDPRVRTTYVEIATDNEGFDGWETHRWVYRLPRRTQDWLYDLDLKNIRVPITFEINTPWHDEGCGCRPN